jgi:alcohol dehydrogenase class IV
LGNPALHRYFELARLLNNAPGMKTADGIHWARAMVKTLAIPGLAAYGLKTADIPGIAQRAAQASSMKGNPILLTNAELTEILERAL